MPRQGHDYDMTNLTLTAALPVADVVTLFAGQSKTGAVELLSTFGTASVVAKIETAIAALDFKAGVGDTAKLPGNLAGLTGTVLVVGVGKKKTHEDFRTASGMAARTAAGKKKLAIAVPASHIDAAGAIAEGALLGAYTFNDYRSASNNASRQSVKTIAVVTSAAKDAVLVAAINRAKIVSASVNQTRDLGNTPPNTLTPAYLANFAKEIAATHKLAIEVLDEKALKNKGYGGITGVGQGSVNPPRLIRLAYRHPKATQHLSIVGKGITFDTGGISIKPHLNMHEMKGDMCGAAAVLNTIAAIAQLKLPINVTAYAACAENMPSGSAQRPGDVVTAYGGRTVEVLNTDAEGRLVLMDALVRAQEDAPDLIVDVATLTGAAVVALGRKIAAAMSPDDALSNYVMDAGLRSGERFWPLPLPADYRTKLDSSVADIANIAEGLGGTLYGGLFLKDFVKESQSWIHLDIAAPAFNSEAAFDYTPKGATGSSVRTLVTIAEDLIAGTLKL
ncbi:MAG: putative cytosol aminopeptidase [Actinomycetota bacterium]